jgi:hypothetical protein
VRYGLNVYAHCLLISRIKCLPTYMFIWTHKYGAFTRKSYDKNYRSSSFGKVTCVFMLCECVTCLLKVREVPEVKIWNWWEECEEKTVIGG